MGRERDGWQGGKIKGEEADRKERGQNLPVRGINWGTVSLKTAGVFVRWKVWLDQRREQISTADEVNKNRCARSECGSSVLVYVKTNRRGGWEISSDLTIKISTRWFLSLCHILVRGVLVQEECARWQERKTARNGECANTFACVGWMAVGPSSLENLARH